MLFLLQDEPAAQSDVVSSGWDSGVWVGIIIGVFGIVLTALSWAFNGFKSSRKRRKEWVEKYEEVGEELCEAMSKSKLHAIINGITEQLESKSSIPVGEFEGLLADVISNYNNAFRKFKKCRSEYKWMKKNSIFSIHCEEVDRYLADYVNYVNDVNLTLFLAKQSDLDIAVDSLKGRKSLLLEGILRSQIAGRINDPQATLLNIVALRFATDSAEDEVVLLKESLEGFIQQERERIRASELQPNEVSLKVPSAEDDSRHKHAVWLIESGSVTDGLEILNKLAEAGHSESQYYLGKYYLASDPSCGVGWLRKAVENKHWKARSLLGKYYLLQDGLSNKQAGYRLLNSDDGYIPSRIEYFCVTDDLISMWFFCANAPEYWPSMPLWDDFVKKFTDFSREGGIIELIAKARLAILYLYGRGCQKDVERATVLMKEARSGLESYFMKSPEDYYFREVSLRVYLQLYDSFCEYYLQHEPDMFVAFVEPFAEKNEVRSQDMLGHYYYRNEDYNNAIKWFRRGVKSGCANSLDNLGLCYLCGYGTPQNMNLAKCMFEEAKARGIAVAFHHMADLYYFGHMTNVTKGLLKDRVIPLYEVAAGRGWADSVYMLGKCYEDLGQIGLAVVHYNCALEGKSPLMLKRMETAPDSIPTYGEVRTQEIGSIPKYPMHYPASTYIDDQLSELDARRRISWLGKTFLKRTGERISLEQ